MGKNTSVFHVTIDIILGVYVVTAATGKNSDSQVRGMLNDYQRKDPRSSHNLSDGLLRLIVPMWSPNTLELGETNFREAADDKSILKST